MNKKFSTLLVGAALLLSSMSVGAQEQQRIDGDFAASLPIGNSGNLFQIAVKTGAELDENGDPTVPGIGADLIVDSVLVVNATGNLVIADPVDVAYQQSLWCINITTERNGANPTYDFTNKFASTLLQVAVEDTLVKVPTEYVKIANGSLGGWKFSSIYEEDLEQGKYLATYFKADSILVFVSTGKTGTGTAQRGGVGVRAYKANDPKLLTDEDILRFSIFVPAGKYLTAEEYNTLFGTTKSGAQSLKFTRDRKNTQLLNPFSDYKLKASQSANDPNTSQWLNFQREGDEYKEKFLRVDTAWTNSVGVKFLNFAFGEKILGDAEKGHLAIPLQYDFALEYFVHNDSVAIDVREARFNNEENKSWHAAYPTKWGVTTGTLSGTDSLHFKVQDLIATEDEEVRIVTIGTAAVNTKAYFGIGECGDGPTATSVDEDVYTIRNTAGQYLVVPVYTDTVPGFGRDALYPQWVSLDGNIDPNYIPAYQWIVEKTRVNDPDQTSPLRLVNREFDIVNMPIMYLNNTDKGFEYAYGFVKPSGFTAVPDAQKADKHLGYKFVDKEMSSVYTYTFEYLHALSGQVDTYLGVNNTATDSILYVGGKTEFQLIPRRDVPAKYGNVPTRKVGKLANVAQLERHAYVLKIKDVSKLQKSNKIVVVDQEKRYAVTDTVNLKSLTHNRLVGLDTALFYLKTNNTKDIVTDAVGAAKKHYYALLDTGTYASQAVSRPFMVKGGVDDDNLYLKVQNQRETRTSAFAVEVNDDPLYRRFNTIKEGSVASDAPDTVEFFRMNNHADKLYEDAYSNYSKEVSGAHSRYQINFLGVQNSSQFPNANYSIYVDTAFVARPATENSIIDTPKPQYMLAVGVEVIPSGNYCPVHGWNANCGHAVPTPGFTKGRYLINATDSAKKTINPGVIRDEKYIWDTKWERLVFVNAIHKGDTLYLFHDNVTFGEGQVMDNETLRKASYKWFDLGNNLHKDVVFSFRLIGNEDNFLIESETTADENNRFAGPMIAPFEGGWVKIQNGVPVISRGAYDDAITDAERWNVSLTTENPTSNDEISVDAVQVVTGAGSVTVKGATGKTVAINDILGKTIVSAKLTKDEQTFSAPAGIVVVSVEGEAAVKAIVK